MADFVVRPEDMMVDGQKTVAASETFNIFI